MTMPKLKICYTYLGLEKTMVTLINCLEVKRDISDSKSYPKLEVGGGVPARGYISVIHIYKF